MKGWQFFKAALYLLVAVSIFIFNQSVLPYVGYLVGSVVCLYAVEELIVSAVKKTFFSDKYRLFDGLVQILIGIILFLVSSDIIKVCLVWGVWSILRESKEMADAIEIISENRIVIINVVESVVVIVMSFFMILNPNERHAHLHVILLGIELLTVILFSFLETYFNRKIKNSLEKEDNSDEDKIDEITI